MKLLLGDCLEKLKELDDNSIDSVVTDPPYGLEFMGKEWDSFKTGRIAKYKEGGSIDLEAIESRKGKGGAGPSYTKRAAKRCRTCGKQEWSGSPCKCDNPDFEIDNSTQLTFQEFSEAWATECYRVLKPGGYMLAFGGSRMYHRLASGVEDAGFEIRDQIMWIYGSGFPKSHNIGKAVDKIGGNSIGWFGEWLKEWREENNIPQSKIAKLFPSKTGGLTGCVSNWELGKNIPTLEEYNKIVEEFDLPFKSLEELEREVIGKKNSACFGNEDRHTIGASKSVEVDITKGNSEWEGWGTALKPAHEPIVMARKPFKGNVADNVLRYGTGGINVDGCRVGTDKVSAHHAPKGTFAGGDYERGSDTNYYETEGRFPANIIFECTCENPKVKENTNTPYNYNENEYKVDGFISNIKPNAPSNYNDTNSGVIHTDPNCPCYILDQQSGNIKGGKNMEPFALPIDNNVRMNSSKQINRKGYEDNGGASRFFYCPKSSKKDRNEGMPEAVPQFTGRPRREDGSVIYKETHPEEWAEVMKDKPRKEKTSLAAAEEIIQERKIVGRDAGQDSRSVPHKTRPIGRQNIHPTVKPTDLMQYLIRLVTPKGGTVLDPFMGSGSTGKAAVREGMDFIGIEREAEYMEIAKSRIGYETNKRKFW